MIEDIKGQFFKRLLSVSEVLSSSTTTSMPESYEVAARSPDTLEFSWCVWSVSCREISVQEYDKRKQ